MKNKRIFATMLVAFLLASTLASCSRRDQFRPPETDASTGEQTTVAGQPDVNHPTDTNPNGGDVTGPNTSIPDIPVGDPSTGDAENGKITGNPYEGWTAEELYASFMADREKSGINNVNGRFGNTPYYVILDVQYGGYMFSKLTGQVVQICKDPICDHKTCIFNHRTSWMRSCQVVDDRCYLAVEGYKGDIYTCSLYSFDLLMNDARLICEWKDMDCPDSIYVYQGKIYYDAEIKFDNGQYGNVTMVYDMKEKTTHPLREQPVRCKGICYVGAYEWYTNAENGALGRYNLDTSKDEVIISSSLLDAEAGDLHFSFLGVSGQTVYVRKMVSDYSQHWLLYDMGTGKLQEIEGITPFIYDGKFYPIVRHDVDAYKDDPYYEYYSVGQTCWGGKVYRTDEKTGDQYEVVNLRTDGIPDSLTNFLLLDGKFLMIEYQTYKDFKNPYSPSIPEWARSERYVVVNLETGLVYELGVDLSTQSYHNRPGSS